MKGNPESMKKLNRNLIFKALIQLTSATRSELAKLTNISLTTIRTLLDEMILSNQIIELELDDSNGGRRAQRYALNKNRNLLLSFYFEEEKIHYIISNLYHHLVHTGVEDFNKTGMEESVITFIKNCLVKWDISAIGIGVSGIVKDQSFLIGCDTHFLISNQLGELVQSTFHLPTILENDLNAIAYGHTIQLKPTNSSLSYIQFNSEYASAGFINDGNIIHGFNQFAGEIGFMPFSQHLNLNDTLKTCTNDIEVTDVIARTIAIINYMMNPATIVIGGECICTHNIKPSNITDILTRNYLLKDLCPDILLSKGYEEDYLKGLAELTFQNFLPHLD